MYAQPRRRDLMIISSGLRVLTMKYLLTFIGQGKILVRPIQEGLPLENPSQVHVSVLVHKERCKRRLALLDVHELRDNSVWCSCPKDNVSAGKAYISSQFDFFFTIPRILLDLFTLICQLYIFIITLLFFTSLSN